MASSLPRRSLIAPEDLARVGRLELEARRPMAGTVAGKHKSPHRGTSIEFAQYREYVPGDDLRRLDWRVYGRTDRFFVKEFEADTNLRLCLVLDASGSMRYRAPSAQRRAKSRGAQPGAEPESESKFDLARRIAALLAYVALRQGDAAGLTLAREPAKDGALLHLPTQRRASHFVALERTLLAVEPMGVTCLAETLHEVAERTAQRAQVIVVSDFFCPLPPLEAALRHLAFENHDVALFQLLEQSELDFEFDRTTRFVDLEGGAPLVVEPSLLGARYRAALERHRAEFARLVDSAAIELHTALLGAPAAEAVVQFLLARASRRGRR